MFFFLCLLSALSYALQNTLMVSYFRAMDTLSAVAYRGLALGLTMLPLLLFVPPQDWHNAWGSSGAIIAAAACALLGNWASASAYRHLPVGICSAVCSSFTTVTAVLLGPLMFHEAISGMQAMWLALLVAGIIGLGAMRSQNALSSEARLLRGICFAGGAGVMFACAFAFIGSVSRTAHPFIAAYFWEFTIGLLGVTLAYLRAAAGIVPVSGIPWRDFRQILRYSSPTVLGTGLYSIATTIGPVAIAMAILTTTMIGSTVFAYYIHRERLSVREWLLIGGLCLVLVGLNLQK